ncbi:oligosaccharide flippase family protein [Candidatus Woesearchaeota archaeon]|nr:oligosaccharide flippase family protein [Candidatus Woesearchaeota archaeon]
MNNIKEKSKDNFYKYSIFIFVCSLITNAAGYFFHFFVGRILGPASYGVLGALLTILYIINVPFNTIQTTIANFTSQLIANNNREAIKRLLTSSLKKIFIYSLIIFIIYILFSKFIANFLKIDEISLIVLSGFLFIVSLLLAVTWGIMQGLQFFKSLGYSMIIQGFVKLTFGLVLVLIGFAVKGAMFAIILSYLIPFLLTLITLRLYIGKGEKMYKTRDIFDYSIPVLIAMMSITLMFSLDIFLVKHFFNNIEAGYYAALAMLGKVVYFGSISIVYVMFPKVIELNSKKIGTRNILLKSLLIVFLFCFVSVLFYYFFPGFTVNLLFGKEYLNIVPLLGKFAVFMSLLSLIYVLIFYNLSLRKKSFIYILLLFNIIEIVLLYIYHQSISQVVNVLFYLSLALFILMFIYTMLSNKNETFNSNTSL